MSALLIKPISPRNVEKKSYRTARPCLNKKNSLGHKVHIYHSVCTNDDLFDRLWRLFAFSVFSLVRVTWRTRSEVIQNPEA